MLKLNFRSLFVFFLLTSIFVGQVLPLDSSFGLFEREEVRESIMSETKADKTDGVPLLPIYEIASDICLALPRQSDDCTFGDHLASAYAILLVGHTPRAPPHTA